MCERTWCRLHYVESKNDYLCVQMDKLFEMSGESVQGIDEGG